jgi:Protein of unknown function (DUF 659)
MEVNDMHATLEKYKIEWAKTGCTLMSEKIDLSLISWSIVPMGTIFLKLVDSSGDFKDVEKLFSMLDEIIEEIGEENVVQVVADSASTYVSAGELLMAKRKKIFWNPCAAHVMDLMLENISKLSIFKDVIGKAKRMCKFIYNHFWVLNLFRQ